MGLAEEFKQSLQTLEQKKDVTVITKFFADDVELKRLTDEDYHGKDGATKFWKEYLNTFKTQDTTFYNTAETDGTALLEWRSEGELPNGKPFSYRGVSVLEHDGEKVSKFRTYYDSAVFAEPTPQKA